MGNAGLRSEKTIELLAVENSKPHKDGLLFRICQYVEYKQKARRENEKLQTGRRERTPRGAI